MTIATWTYYQNDYYGDVITTESLFDKYQYKAADKLQYICFDRLNDDVIHEYEDKLMKATCALADALYQIEQAVINANDPQKGNIKSMSSGSESVSFGSTDTIYTKVMNDVNAQNKLLRELAAEFIGNTGLMYAGV